MSGNTLRPPRQRGFYFETGPRRFSCRPPTKGRARTKALSARTQGPDGWTCGSKGWDRTNDPQVMGLPSYRCSTLLKFERSLKRPINPATDDHGNVTSVPCTISVRHEAGRGQKATGCAPNDHAALLGLEGFSKKSSGVSGIFRSRAPSRMTCWCADGIVPPVPPRFFGYVQRWTRVEWTPVISAITVTPLAKSPPPHFSMMR